MKNIPREELKDKRVSSTLGVAAEPFVRIGGVGFHGGGLSC